MKSTLLSILVFSLIALFSCNSSSTEEVVEEVTTIEAPMIQVLEPVKWTYATEKIGDNEYKITFNASIEDAWYVYSSTIADDGPIPTSINFDENEALKSVGAIVESGEVTKDGYDDMFDMNIKKFGHAATFSQTVKTSGPTSLSGYMEFMTCDSVQCLFPDPIEFTIDAK
jgi:hypothetical protein